MAPRAARGLVSGGRATLAPAMRLSDVAGAPKLRGAHFDKRTKKWRSSLMVNGVRHHLGEWLSNRGD